MPSVLFVCNANRFRSPLAAACLRAQLAGEDPADGWRVESAGTWATIGLPAPRMALDAAASLGLGGALDDHRARRVDQELLEAFDLVLVMEAGQKEALCAEFPSACGRVHLLPELVDGLPYDVPDPAVPGVDPAESAALLSDLVRRGFGKIKDLAGSLS